MKTAIALAVVLGLSTGTLYVAAQSQADGQNYEEGSTVTVQGCVTAADKKDTWVFTNVKEWPSSNSDMGKYGRRFYWLDKDGKEFRKHAGHTIQVTGTIKSVKKSEIEVKADEDRGTVLEIEGPGTNVSTSSGNLLVGAITGQDIPITLLTLKVDGIKTVVANCNP